MILSMLSMDITNDINDALLSTAHHCLNPPSQHRTSPVSAIWYRLSATATWYQPLIRQV
jgi:hypothetical protein